MKTLEELLSDSKLEDWEGLLEKHNVNYYDVFKKKEEKIMGESQSRYSIMEELSQEKIETRQDIANLESKLRQRDAEVDKTRTDLENLITSRKANYKSDHVHWKKVKGLEKKRLQAEFERNTQAIDEDIADRDENLETNFSVWLTAKNTELEVLAENWANEKLSLEKQVETKKAILEELEASITSLKEISKEHTTK